MNTLNKEYISPIDQKLQEFNETHEKSASQRAEIEKYSKIHSLRDKSQEESPHAII